MSLVARHVSHEHWRQLTATLSRSEQGLLAHCLLHDVIGARIFVSCALEPDCLTCTCDLCPLGPSRAGVMCPGEIAWVSTGLLRAKRVPGSPARLCGMRKPSLCRGMPTSTTRSGGPENCNSECPLGHWRRRSRDARRRGPSVLMQLPALCAAAL